MIPIEKITGGQIAIMIYDVSIIGLLLVVATLCRLKISFLRKMFIPASVLAGIFGLLLGPHVFKVIPPEMMSTMGALPGQLITIVFACMLLGVRRRESAGSLMHDAVSGLGWIWSCALMQAGLGALLCGLVFTPMFGVNELFGSMFEIGFAGGHGTAGGMSSVFRETYAWEDGATLGATTATIGLLCGIIVGMIIINFGVRKGYTKVLTEPAKDMKIKETFGEGEREPSAHASINQDVVEPFAFHLGIIGIAILIGRAIVWGFGVLVGYKGLPLFPFAMIGGWIINAIVQRTAMRDLFDRRTFQRIQGMALEVLIVGAMASISIPIVVAYWIPLTIGSAAIILMMFVWFFWLSPRIFNDCWFEHGIIRFGAYTGVAAIGYMLLRTADPKMETDAGTVYALDGPFTSPFVGGGLVTSAWPALIAKFGATGFGFIACGISLAIVAFLLIFFRNKNFKMRQR